MLPVVAMAEARPETIAEDCRRVLALAGLDKFIRDSHPVFVPGAARRGWTPGFGTPPWQLAAALAAADPGTGRIFPVGTGRRTSVPDSGRWGWEKASSTAGARPFSPEERAAEAVHVPTVLPALESVCPGGLKAPPVVRETPLMLLPVPRLCREWGLSGAVSLLDGLLATDRRGGGRMPAAEIQAEVAGFARAVAGPVGVLMDATVWGVASSRGRPTALMRNMLLAGTDPVAVDAVAVRLTGQDPSLVPWLRLCRDRGWGEIDLDRMRLRGQTDLLSLDFQGPRSTLATCGGPGGRGLWPRLTRAWGSLGAAPSSERPAAWDRLFEEFRMGAV